MDEFCRMLHTLQSVDTADRNAAEKAYAGMPESQKIEFLMQVMQTNHLEFQSGDPSFEESSKLGAKLMAAVLLRKEIASIDSGLFTMLNDSNSMAGFKGQIVQILQAEHNYGLTVLSQKLANILADTFVMDQRNSWPESRQLIENLARAGDSGMCLAMNAILSYPQLVEELGSGKVVNMVSRGLTSENTEIQYISARAACSYLVDREPDDVSSILGFAETLDHIMKIIKISVEDDNDTVIKQFIDVVECESLIPLLQRGFDVIIKNSLEIIASESVNEENRQLALEVVVSLVETFPQPMRKMIKKCEKLNQPDPIVDTLKACLNFIGDVEDDSDEGQGWLQIDGEDDTGANSNALTGEAALDRIACALRGGIVVPRIKKLLESTMGSPDWRMRYTGLVAISAIAEGCNTHMGKELKNFTATVINFCDDSNARVRYAAANTIGQLAIDFGEKFCKLAHDPAIAKLCGLLDDPTKAPRVIGQAAAALVNFCENLPHSIMTQYAETVINIIGKHMTNEFKEGRQFTLQQLITLLAALAGQLDNGFKPYHGQFMPALANIISSTIADGDASTEYTKLRGKAIECFSIIGLAIGKEEFAAYVTSENNVMDKMLKLQLTPEMWAEEDETISYMISAWARIAKVMGSDFAQYLPSVMPPLLKACKITPSVQVIEDGENTELDEEKWSLIRMPNDTSQIGIKTSCIELKRTAFSMLVCYVKEVGDNAAFVQYNDEVASLAQESLAFYFDEDVRVHAAEIITALVEHHGIKFWTGFGLCEKLVTAIEQDPDETVKPELMDCFARAVESLLDDSIEIFQDGELEKIFDLIGGYVKEHIDNAQERNKQRHDEDHNDGDEEELVEGAEADEYILQKVADMLHSIFGTQKHAALPFYDPIHPLFVQLINKDNIFTDRQWALCVFDDILERCGQHSVKYSGDILPNLIDGLSDEIGEIRQACAYGIGILAKAVCEASIQEQSYIAALQQAFSILGQQAAKGLQQAKEDRDQNREPEEEEFEVEPWDNVVSAMGKILKFTAVLIEKADVQFKSWLQLLDQQGGITGDQEEAEATMNWLHDIIRNPSHQFYPLLTEASCLRIYSSLVGDLLVSGILNDDGVEVRNKNLQILMEMSQQNSAHFMQLTDAWEDSKKFLFQDTVKDLQSV